MTPLGRLSLDPFEQAPEAKREGLGMGACLRPIKLGFPLVFVAILKRKLVRESSKCIRNPFSLLVLLS